MPPGLKCPGVCQSPAAAGKPPCGRCLTGTQPPGLVLVTRVAAPGLAGAKKGISGAPPGHRPRHLPVPQGPAPVPGRLRPGASSRWVPATREGRAPKPAGWGPRGRESPTGAAGGDAPNSCRHARCSGATAPAGSGQFVAALCSGDTLTPAASACLRNLGERAEPREPSAPNACEIWALRCLSFPPAAPGMSQCHSTGTGCSAASGTSPAGTPGSEQNE